MHCNMFNQTRIWRFPRWIIYHHNLPKCNFTTVYVQKAEKEFYNIARIFAYYKITKIVRAFWLVKTLCFIVPVKLFYKSNRPHFLWVYKVWSIASFKFISASVLHIPFEHAYDVNKTIPRVSFELSNLRKTSPKCIHNSTVHDEALTECFVT